jgi:hypothetical protein
MLYQQPVERAAMSDSSNGGDLDPASRRLGEPAAATAFRWAIFGGLLLMLGANLPGHLTYDSVVQLFEGRTGVRQTWAPATLSWLLGRFDHLVPGTGLYVTACGLVLSASLASLRSLRPRTTWLAPVLAAGFVLTPALLIYQAIVWKDVLFANLTIAGFVCLAHAAAAWREPRRRVLPLAAALLCLSAAMLVRQNGLIVVAAAAAALAWTARGGGWRASAAFGLGGLAAMLLLSHVIGAAVQPRNTTMDGDTHKGMRILQHYDIVGAQAHDPSLRLSVIEQANPRAAALISTVGARIYSPERVDTLADAPDFQKVLWRLPDTVVSAQWRDLIVNHTGAYLAQRMDAFRWVFLTPDIDQCLPYSVGIDGPLDDLKALGIPPAVEPQDEAMDSYGSRFKETPAFSHLAYALAALGVAILLLLRREPADMVMAALMIAALAFAASFFVISLACDYRYLYALDLAAITGLLYLALDPPLPSRRPGGARRSKAGVTLH